MAAMSKLDQDMNSGSPDEGQAAIQIGIKREITMHHNFQGNIGLNVMKDEINDLKEQLEQKDEELTDLRKKVKDLEEKNNNLQITLDSKDKEVKALKERIQNLEEEKKSLQKELASVQFKLKAVEDDVKKLSKLRESDEEKYDRLEEKFKKIQYTLEGVVEDLRTTKKVNKKLEVELRQVRHQSRYVAGAPLLLPVEASDEKNAVLHLGKMCCEILDELYKQILPEHFTPIMNYQVKTFLRDIEKLPKSQEEKSLALKRWEDLKTDVQWNEDLEGALDALQDMYKRNTDATPPKLCKSVLEGYATFLRREGFLKGCLAFEHVSILINIWKRLVD